MWIYLFVLLVPLTAAWAAPRRGRITMSMLMYFLMLLSFIGLRDEVGPDWTGYVNILNVSVSSIDSLRSEQLFAYLNIVSENLGFDIYGVVFVAAFLFLAGVFAYASQTARPWLAIAVVLPYLGFVMAMSSLRQTAAIGIGYCALAYWRRLSLISRGALILLAMGFHMSAAFFFLFALLEGGARLWLKLAGVVALTAALLMKGAGDDDQLRQTYSARYLESTAQGSSGAYAHVALNTLPAILYLWRRKQIAAAGWDNPLVTIGAIGAIAAFPLVSVSSTGVDRLALYFSYIQMWIYPALVATFEQRKTMYLSAISFLTLLVFLVYFTLGTHAYSYLPYKNVLFP